MDQYGRREPPAPGPRATPEELREAAERHKAFQDELRHVEIAPEVRQGEDRLDRYERELRLRSLREEFETQADLRAPRPGNAALLALVMTVASFLLCAFCAGGTYFGLRLLEQRPDAASAGSGFWSELEVPDYQTAYDTYVSPGLKVQLTLDQFNTEASAADKQFGHVSGAILVKQSISGTQAALSYTVVRTGVNGKHTSYPVTLALTESSTAWTVADFGFAFTPPGFAQPNPVPTPSPTSTSTSG